jgi:hypothetical protein
MFDKNAHAKHAPVHADAKAHEAKAHETPAPATAAPSYDGPDRRVSAIGDRRLAPADRAWPPVKFPAWRYHATEGSKVVATQEESDALGAGWSADGPIVRK